MSKIGVQLALHLIVIYDNNNQDLILSLTAAVAGTKFNLTTNALHAFSKPCGTKILICIYFYDLLNDFFQVWRAG